MAKLISFQPIALIKGNTYTKRKNLSIAGALTHFKTDKNKPYLFKPKRTTSKGAFSSGK